MDVMVDYWLNFLKIHVPYLYLGVSAVFVYIWLKNEDSLSFHFNNERNGICWF